MIQLGSLALILWQAVELSIGQTWNIGAAEAAADKVRLSSQRRRNATFEQGGQGLNMRLSDIVDVAAGKREAGDGWNTDEAEEESRILHPIDECSARTNHDVALVDHVTVRHELVAWAEDSGGAGGGVRTHILGHRFEVV
jgi:hypothetical protein